MSYKVISCYKYVQLEDPQVFRDEIKQWCQNLHLLGRILIGKEGLNCAVCGKDEDIEQFKQSLLSNFLLAGLTFREQRATQQVYHKLVVRVRPEIVNFGVPVDIKSQGTPLTPAELEQWYEQKNVVIIDARNEAEHRVGKFKDAITLPIKNFREFPAQLTLLNQFRDKKVVLYCTGGIRCEKASAYLKQQGFEQVYQLQGGILNYLQQFPSSNWQGGLFVFDDRIVSETATPITECQYCGISTPQYQNCHNLDCDKLFVACTPCLERTSTTCSPLCQQASRQRVNA